MCYEREDSTWVARATALAGWVVDFDGKVHFRTCEEASLERLSLAMNDQPVWLRLSAAHVHADAGVARVKEWRDGLGLLAQIPKP